MNWAEIGAVAAIAAVIEAPMIAIGLLVWGWAREVNTRLARIEQRSHQVRRGDY